MVPSGIPTVTNAPSALPSSIPSLSPSGFPSATPSLSPTTEFPSSAPSRICEIDSSFRCLTEEDQTPCEDITGEENLTCFCADCVQSLQFIYNGNSCDDNAGPFGTCSDIISPLPEIARILVTSANGALFDDIVELGDSFTVTSADGCLPEGLSVFIQAADGSGFVFQSLFLDASCDADSGLELLDTFGSLEFVGFGCDEFDFRSCFVDVVYFLRTCNDDAVDDLILFNMDFALNETQRNLLPGGVPLILEPAQCFQSFLPFVVERCMPREYVASVFARASFDFGGPFCFDEEVITFDTIVNSTQPMLNNETRRNLISR